MSLSNEAAQAVASAASKAMYGGGATAFVGGLLTFNQWLALGGFLIGLAGFVVNWVYKHKHYKLLKAKVDAEFPDGD